MSGLRDLLDAATPGPWKFDGASDEGWPQSENSLRSMTAVTTVAYGWGYDASGLTVDNPADAELIALAPVLAQLVLDMADELLHDRNEHTHECLPGCVACTLVDRVDRLTKDTP